MKYFRIGNVVKTSYDTMVIITRITGADDNPQYHWVSFDSSNCSGVSRYKNKVEEEHCFDDDGYICGDPDCEICHGTGLFNKTIHGFEEATVLADNVKDYIIKRLTQNFDF